MSYDPKNELTSQELDELSKVNFDKFLEYLDAKAAYLKKSAGPLRSHESKRYVALTEAISKLSKIC